jgi:glycosyltransferase involved in cell wall biosynthesis
MKKHISVSIIVPCYNRLENSQKCVDSLLNQNYPTESYEIIIIDDASTDQTQSYFEKLAYNFSNIKYFRNNQNFGRVLTRNKGILESNGELVIFLDNDMIVNYDFIEAHVLAHKNNDYVSRAVIGKISYPLEAINNSNFGRYIQSRALGYRSAKDMRNVNINDLDSKFFAGGNSSCLKSDVIKAGMFDVDFEKYGGEDEYFGYSLKKKGVNIIYAENAYSLHNDFNVGPNFWKIKYNEIGKYGISEFIKKNDYIKTSNINLLIPGYNLSDGLFNNFKKFSLNILNIYIISRFINFYVIKTDSKRLFYNSLIYKIAQVIWIKQGIRKNTEIKTVNY